MSKCVYETKILPKNVSISIIGADKIKIYINKKWKQRFCVFAKPSDSSATVKVFVYKDPNDYKKSVDLSVQQPFDTVYGLDSFLNLEKSPVRSAIVLTCEEKPVLLGFNCNYELAFWLEKLGKCFQDASYRARFVKCESVGKPMHQLSPAGTDYWGLGIGNCDGRLHVQPPFRLCFYSEPAEACKSLAVWPLQFVKRYMVNEAMGCFVFEGDIGCGRFRGMQYFQCDRRHDVYTDMKAACANKPMPSFLSRE